MTGKTCISGHATCLAWKKCWSTHSLAPRATPVLLSLPVLLHRQQRLSLTEPSTRWAAPACLPSTSGPGGGGSSGACLPCYSGEQLVWGTVALLRVSGSCLPGEVGTGNGLTLSWPGGKGQLPRACGSSWEEKQGGLPLPHVPQPDSGTPQVLRPSVRTRSPSPLSSLQGSDKS